MSHQHGFQPTATGVQLVLEPSEATVLRTLVGQLEDLVRPEPASSRSEDSMARLVGIDETAATPQDSAVARLFPDAYGDDPDAAGEFRRFTERGLRDRRMEQCTLLRDLLAGDPAASDPETGDLVVAELSPTDCASVLGVLNDLRLVLGTRLGIEDDDDNREDFVASDDPRAQMFAVYQWLTYLQSELLASLIPEG